MPTAPSLHGALTSRMNYLVARQGVIAGNIANADTPGYLSQDLAAPRAGQKFSGALAMARTSGGHMQAGGGGGAQGRLGSSGAYMQHNGNAVRLDNELNKMNQTKLEYQAMTRLYGKQVQMQKLALGRQQ